MKDQARTRTKITQPQCVKCSEHKVKMNEIKQENKKLKRQNATLDKILTKQRRMDPEIDDIAIKVATVEDENGTLMTRIQELKDDKYELKAENSRLLARTRVLKKHKRELKAACVALIKKLPKQAALVDCMWDSDELDSDED